MTRRHALKTLAIAAAGVLVEARCPSSSAELEAVSGLWQECAAQDDKCKALCDARDRDAHFDCNATVSALQAELGVQGLCGSDDGALACGEALGDSLAARCAEAVYLVGSVFDCGDGGKGALQWVDGSEFGRSGANCGGPFCAPCAGGEACRTDSDCKSKVCSDKVCEAELGGEQVAQSTFLYYAVAVPVLALTTLVTFIVVHCKKLEETRRREREKRREEKEALLREKETRRTHPPKANKTMLRLPSRMSLKGSGSSRSGSRGGGGGGGADDANTGGPEQGAAGSDAPSKCTTLLEVLENREARNRFYDFCKTKFAAENILFWEDIRAYEALWDEPEVSSKAVQAKARAIVEKYIADNAVTEVNLAYFRRCEILAVYQQSEGDLDETKESVFTQDTFHEAKTEILSLMSTNFFSEFKDKHGKGDQAAEIAPASGPAAGAATPALERKPSEALVAVTVDEPDSPKTASP